MSHKWTANAYDTLLQHAMEEARRVIQQQPWIISHDNVNVPIRVFSQHLHNQSHFISGCAATVWVLPAMAALPSDANKLLRIQCAQGINDGPFQFADLLDGNVAAYSRIRQQYIYHVLRILIDSPEFSDYKFRGDNHFKPPPAVNPLPYGPDHTVRQYILGMTDIDESSYEGNDRVIAEFFRQLELNSKDEQKKTGLIRLLLWIGDQMTVEQLWGLFKYHYEDFNSFDCMDYMVPLFRWFHMVMAFANSLHKQYLGYLSIIRSLQQAFDVLQRKGLQKPETKGPFWHHLHEALYHVGEAHLRATWLIVADVMSLTKLKMKHPADLCSLATKLIDEQASRKALTKMRNMPEMAQENVLTRWITFNSDILSYIELTTAIKYGDVGWMEDMLPIMLFCFAGGGNPKYTIEILELMQGLRKEWPDIVK